MTVPTTTSSVIYTGVGSVDIYNYTWQIADQADLIVFRLDEDGESIDLLTITTDYTVTGVGVFTGGTVVLVDGDLATGDRLFIASDPEQVQELLLQQGAAFNPAAVMAALDLACRQIQANRRLINVSLQIPVAESLDGYEMTFPSATERAGTLAGFDAGGNVTTTALTPSLTTFTAAATLGAMKALVGPTNGTIVKTAGYYAAGDLGNGTYVFNAADVSADNGGTVIAPDAGTGRWNLLYNGVINIRQFGARGNGSECAATFTAAIAVLMARTPVGGTIYVPTGVYRIDSIVTFRAGISVIGDGVEVTKFDLRVGASLRWYEASLTDINGGGLEKVTVATTGAVTNAVDVKNVWGFRCRHNRIYATDNLLATGLELRDYSFEADVHSCRITDVTTNGIKFSSSGVVFANATTIQNCDLHGEDGAVQINNLGADGVKVIGTYFERGVGQGGTAIDINGTVTGMVVANCLIGGNYADAAESQILIRGGAQKIVITGNYISVTGGHAIIVSGAGTGYVSVTGNVLEIDFGTDVFKVDGRYTCAFTGNTVKLVDSGAEGLTGSVFNITGSATDITLSGNIIYGEGAGDMAGTGITIDNGCSGITIMGGSIVNMTVGIDCNSASASKVITLSGVSFTGNGTAATITAITAICVRDCPGIKTAGYGNGTILNTTTTVNVAHGLAITPTSDAITLQAYGNSTNRPRQVWVSAVDATNISVACDADPGASGLPFSWQYQPGG
ncbi:MAG: hypothetical protein V4636_13155 [Pseudomonadota bacterium]